MGKFSSNPEKLSHAYLLYFTGVHANAVLNWLFLHRKIIEYVKLGGKLTQFKVKLTCLRPMSKRNSILEKSLKN